MKSKAGVKLYENLWSKILILFFRINWTTADFVKSAFDNKIAEFILANASTSTSKLSFTAVTFENFSWFGANYNGHMENKRVPEYGPNYTSLSIFVHIYLKIETCKNHCKNLANYRKSSLFLCNCYNAVNEQTILHFYEEDKLSPLWGLSACFSGYEFKL